MAVTKPNILINYKIECMASGIEICCWNSDIFKELHERCKFPMPKHHRNIWISGSFKFTRETCLSSHYSSWLQHVCVYGCFLKWWHPQNTPKWSFLVGKPMVVGYHQFRIPPYEDDPVASCTWSYLWYLHDVHTEAIVARHQQLCPGLTFFRGPKTSWVYLGVILAVVQFNPHFLRSSVSVKFWTWFFQNDLISLVCCTWWCSLEIGSVSKPTSDLRDEGHVFFSFYRGTVFFFKGLKNTLEIPFLVQPFPIVVASKQQIQATNPYFKGNCRSKTKTLHSRA